MIILYEKLLKAQNIFGKKTCDQKREYSASNP